MTAPGCAVLLRLARRPRRAVNGDRFELEQQRAARSKQDLVPQEAVSGIGELVIAPVSEAFTFAEKQRGRGWIVNQRTPHVAVGQMPDERIVCVQDLNRRLHRMVRGMSPSADRLGQWRRPTSVAEDEMKQFTVVQRVAGEEL